MKANSYIYYSQIAQNNDTVTGSIPDLNISLSGEYSTVLKELKDKAVSFLKRITDAPKASDMEVLKDNAKKNGMDLRQIKYCPVFVSI